MHLKAGIKMKKNNYIYYCIFILCFGMTTLSSGILMAQTDLSVDKLLEKDEKLPEEAAEKYEKAKEGPFEVQGFGKDFSPVHKIQPQPENIDEQTPGETSEDQKVKEGADPNVITTQEELENQMQLQRRVDIFYEGRVRFKNGAAIWATEDAGSSTPKLEIRAPEFVDINQDKIRFNVFTNYFPFINKWQLRIFKVSEIDTESEVAILEGGPSTFYHMEYEFEKGKFQDGESLYYQLKVFQDDQVFDVIRTKKITFMNRIQNQNLQETNEESEWKQLAEIWGQDAIEKQNIPIRGSRVRIVGTNLPRNNTIFYREQSVQVDENGTFVIEEHFPIGQHQVQVKIKEEDSGDEYTVPFDVEITGKYLFFVGLADFRVGENKLSEKVVSVGSHDEFADSFLDGRLAFYLKGKVQGKYLITAQMDTTEGPIENMFDGLHRKNAESLFRRLDPDRYYPVYGDNSNTYESAPSAGRFFVKVEMDQSYLMWGNDHTDMSRTLLSQYNRTLYGAHLKFQSNSQTKYGDRKTKIKAFAAEPETLLGHNEFLGTGGRVYILRHNDVVQGSEKMVLEVRDRDSGIMKKQVALKPFQDYEFDYLAGRVVLTQPLTTFAMQDGGQIIDNNTVGSDLYYLVADYEYNATGGSLGDSSFGTSVEQWLGNHVSVGGTYVSEKRAADEYTLTGIDASLRLGQDSFIKVERSETDNVQSLSNFVSNDGGLSFAQKPQTVLAQGKAEAWAFETQMYLNDFLKSKDDAVLTTWYRDYEAGFSTARRQAQNDITEYGYNLEYKFMDKNVVKSKISSVRERNFREEDMFLFSYGRQFSLGSTISAEYRQDTIKNLAAATEGRGEVVGAKISQMISPELSVYAKAQSTIKEEGLYSSNDRWAIGTKFRFAQKWEGLAEYSDGDRGTGSNVGLGYNIDSSYKVYGNFDKSIDTMTGQSTNGLTLGQRKRFDNGFSLTSENQFDTVADSAGVTQLYGLDYNISRVLTAGASVQNGDLENRLTGEMTSKDAVNAHITYAKDNTLFASSKASYVKQRGGMNFNQLLLTNSLRFRTGASHTWSLRADYSETEDPNLVGGPLARYVESNASYAYRPVTHDRLNFFLRYTFLYDLDSQAQVNARNDQRVNIISAEAAYDVSRRWEVGGRVAQKIGSERITRGSGPWTDATLTFAQLRVRYHILKKWDGVFELRAVEVKENQDFQAGTLLGLDYHLGGNLKIGGGFNFTRFNDDMTNFNFDNYGWFINIVGKM